ncbi:MAG: hypothetical protein CMG50_03220 [Candidatus Marinimicrobia bacterium]|nr:hypothetical protein [Candidatus Neomarinimicrobiota bacterium]
MNRTELIKNFKSKAFKDLPTIYQQIKLFESSKEILYNANIIIFQSSLINHKKRLSLLKIINDLSVQYEIPFCIAHNLTLLIKLNRELGVKKNLIKDSHKAIDLWRSIIDDPLAINGLIFTYTDLGLLFSDFNLNLLAIKYLDKASSLIDECENRYNPSVKLNVAYSIVYDKMRKYKKSKTHYDKVIKLAESKNDTITIIPILINKANNLIKRKKNNLAKEKCEIALRISKDNNDEIYKPYIYHSLGKAYLNFKDFTKSKKYLYKALDLFDNMNIVKMVPEVLYDIGLSLYRIDKNNDSIKIFKILLRKNKKIKNYELDVKTLKILLEIYKKNKNHKLYLSTIDKLNKSLEDSLKYKSKIFSDTNIDALEYLSNENNIAVGKENDLKIKLDIESNKRKLTTKALVSFSEREFLKNIINKLSNQNLTNNNLIKLCNDRMMHTKNWDVFMKLFNDIHPDFNRYIISKAISISESELRVCNLIKMNFSTLETAEILAITIRGVEQHRYRIKKKLKLKTDLTVFLQSI